MKSNVFQLSHKIKNIHRSKLQQQHTHWRKGFLQLPLLMICGSFLFRQSKKTYGILQSIQSMYTQHISRGEKTKQILLLRRKFSFLFIDIWFDVTKYQFIMQNSSFKMLVVFSSIFVEDTKITFVYNFVVPLKSENRVPLNKEVVEYKFFCY